MNFENNKECFVRLWRRLERTRQLLASRHKRFCIRHILQEWFGKNDTDDFIWEVCNLLSTDGEAPVCGYDELPPLTSNPRRHRELLRAIVAVRLDIGMRKVDLKALDAAYSVVFPHRPPLNVNKKKRLIP